MSEHIIKASARRRERVLEKRFSEAMATVGARDETIKLQRQQIGELICSQRERGTVLAVVATRLEDFAADMKVLADVLRAHGAEDAEARLRTLADGCEIQCRRIAAVLDNADGCMALGERRTIAVQ